MKTVWVKNLAEQEATEVRQEYVGAARFRAKLAELLNAKREERRAHALSSNTYANPSWAYEQADAIGYERALKEVISLISDKSV